MIKYNQELIVALNAAQQASREILSFYYGEESLATTIKEDNTPVTRADLRSNEIINDNLQHYFPKDGIVSEELAAISGRRTWYIDPIDGTRGFIERTDQFAIHIGLVEDEQPVFGLVYKPTTGEYFWGARDCGARRVSPTGIEKILSLSSSPPSDHSQLRLVVDKDFFYKEPGSSIINELKPKSILTSGSEGLRLMKIVEGSADVHLTNNNNSCSSWDLCAPQAIVEAAGGIVRYVDGSPFLYQRQQKLGKYFIAASSSELADDISLRIEPILQNFIYHRSS